jgi:hypothetical protein
VVLLINVALVWAVSMALLKVNTIGRFTATPVALLAMLGVTVAPWAKPVEVSRSTATAESKRTTERRWKRGL